ncbi:MAG: hypothetical protein GX868_08060 [Actinobacteria bacterium]|nr:hypothetical protein [Actinomycetota bacterium]
MAGAVDATSGAQITPTPTDEEAAAIVASLALFSGGGGIVDDGDDTPRWRWSGRWWSKPVPLRRQRPW